MSIGDKIRQRRQEKGWSLRELSRRMGYANQSTVARIEKGEIDIPQSKVVKFAEVLGVSVSYIMGWDEEIEKRPVEMAERHFEIIMDEDINDIFDDFRSLNPAQRKIVKDLVHSLAQTKTEA